MAFILILIGLAIGVHLGMRYAMEESRPEIRVSVGAQMQPVIGA